MFLERFNTILGTGGGVSALGADPGGDDALIQEDHQDEGEGQHLFDALHHRLVCMVGTIGQSLFPV